MPQIDIPQFPDVPSGSPLALAMIAAFVIMALIKRRREGSPAGSPGKCSRP
jgi:hypothetical protein